jgi:hypothetical protein
MLAERTEHLFASLRRTGRRVDRRTTGVIMAANTIVTSPTRPARWSRTPGSTDPVARAAARTAPRGPGLATVVALPVARPIGLPEAGEQQLVERTPALRVVSPALRPTRTVARTVALLAVSALLVAAVLGTVMTAAEEPIAAGHVVLQPGETLWDIAVRSAPAGVDPRRQLDIVRRLNGFGPGALDAWTVVLIPAP